MKSSARGPFFAALLAHAGAGCGYQLAHAPHDPLGPFAVSLGPIHAPDAALAAEAEEGARAELARAGELGGRGATSEIELTLLRVDEASEGVALASPDLPLARAVRVIVTGRARLRRAGSTTSERDTGDVRVTDAAARASSTPAALVVRDEAGRAAARRLGALLVRRLLGFPEPGEP
jgi:hypothetical protein